MAPPRAQSTRSANRADAAKSVGANTSAGSKKGAGTNAKRPRGFTDEEKSAMREHVRELRAQGTKANGEADVLAAIAKMPETDRAIAERVHTLIKAAAPALAPRTWYGMPAYAKDGDVICYFQNAGKFKARYQLLGFSDKAKLDENSMWPTAFALTKLTATEEARITELVTRALR